jgi:hypothetical protein
MPVQFKIPFYKETINIYFVSNSRISFAYQGVLLLVCLDRLLVEDAVEELIHQIVYLTTVSGCLSQHVQ